MPLITYAEEAATATGLHLLAYGDTVLANPCSFIGNVGFQMSPYMLRNFADRWNFQVKLVTKGQNKARFNRFEEHRQEDVEWALKLMRERVKAINSHLLAKRGEKSQ